MTDQNFDDAATFTNPEIQPIYRSLDAAIRTQKPVSGMDLARRAQLAYPSREDVVDAQIHQQGFCTL